MNPTELKKRKAENLRYKKPALASLSYEAITSELDEMLRLCNGITYLMDRDGYETIIESLDGDADEAFEFKMLFHDLEHRAETLQESFYNYYCDDFNDFTVALVGNRYNLLGYDSMEEDYYALTSYDEDLAFSEAGKRVCRHTKVDMLAKIGQCMGTVLAFYDLRQQFDYLQATLEILRGDNLAMLNCIVRLDELYHQAEAEGFVSTGTATKEMNSLLKTLPDRFWVE